MCVQNRYTGEGVRLLSDILDPKVKLNIDSPNHVYLLLDFQFVFRYKFMDWIKLLTINPERFVIYSSIISKKSKLEREAQECDSISDESLIIGSERMFALINIQ